MRDEDGRLKVMYHGSTSAGFTIFNPAQSDDHRSLFFTDSPSVAESYSDTGVEFRPDRHYSFDELSEVVKSLFDGGWRLARNGDSIGIINEDDDVVFTGSADEVRDELIDLRSETGLRGPGNYKVYLNLENPYVYDARGKQWNRLRAPEYDRDVRHEYKSIESFFNPDVNKYSVIGTTAEGEKEYLVRLMTLDEVEAKYGPAFRNFLEDNDYAAQPRTNVDRAINYDIGFDGEWRPLDNRYTTRKVARYAEENGYDGVIFKNIIDIGKYGWSKEASTVAVAFRKDQVKTVDNKNPSFAADIRRSVGIDETWNDDFDWSAESEVIQSGLSEALHSGNEILKGTTVNKADVKKIARRISAHYGSRISVDEFADTLTKVFAYAQQQEYINYDDLATVVSEVASPLIEQSTVKTGAKEFKDFKQALQGYTFNLDERQQKEVISAFGSWGAFRKALPGIKFTRDGSGVCLDGVWDTLCEESGYVLSRDVTSNDMPLELVDAYRAMKPTYQNAFGEDAQSAAQDAAMEIVSKYYQYAAQQEKLVLKKKQKLAAGHLCQNPAIIKSKFGLDGYSG